MELEGTYKTPSVEFGHDWIFASGDVFRYHDEGFDILVINNLVGHL